MYHAFKIILIILFLSVSVMTVGAQDYQAIFREAMIAAQQGDLETATKLYERTIKINPNFAPAYNYLGLAYQQMGLDPIEVAWYFKTAVDIDPQFEDAYINLGKSYYGLGHFDLAEKHTLKALELNPNSTQAKLSIGWIYLLGKSRPKDAIVYFKEIAEKWQNPSAYFGLGMAYFMSGESPQVLECITKLREMQQDDLATQLEGIVRSYDYQAAPQDQPLLQHAGPSQDPLARPLESRMSVSDVAGPMEITVTGTIPVRLSGKLIEEPPAAPKERKSGVLKAK